MANPTIFTSKVKYPDHAANMQNRNLQKNNSTGVRGVTQRDSGKYCARVRLGRKVVYYEQFGTLDEAARAVEEARRQHLPYSMSPEAV